jgi:hypothetical protein
MGIPFLIFLAAVGAIVVFVVVSYNRLVSLTQRSQSSWSDVDVQLKRRTDLVPNLVESVKGYAAMSAAPSTRWCGRGEPAVTARTPESRAEGEAQLSQALRGLFALAESYPDLKASASFQSLQASLGEIEESVQNARRYFNAGGARSQHHHPGVPVQSRGRLLPVPFSRVLRAGPPRRAAGAEGLLRELGVSGAFSSLSPSSPPSRHGRRLSPAPLPSSASPSPSRWAADATLRVREAITVDFRGSHQGIFRTIPVRYERRGVDFALRVDDVHVFDESVAPLKTEVQHLGRAVRIRAWVPGALNATKTVIITYRVRRALIDVDGHEELYWNVTGTDWDVPIRQVEAIVSSPPGIPLDRIDSIAYTGPLGASGTDYTEERADTFLTFRTTRPLRPREGLTIAVGWPPGAIRGPGVIQQSWWFLGDNWPLGLPLLALGGLFPRLARPWTGSEGGTRVVALARIGRAAGYQARVPAARGHDACHGGRSRGGAGHAP